MRSCGRLSRFCAGAAALVLGVQPLCASVFAETDTMSLRLTLDQTVLSEEDLADADAVIHGALYIENYTGISAMRIVIANDEGVVIENGGFSDPCYLEGREEARNVYNPYSEVHDVSNLIVWYGPYGDDGVSWANTPVVDENASFVEFDVRIPQGTPAGDYSIYLDQRSLTLESGKQFPLFSIYSEDGEYGDELPAVEAIGCTITIVPEEVMSGNGIWGDVNCDGVVDTQDGVSVLQFYNQCHIMGNDDESAYLEWLDPVFPEVAFAVSDVNEDGIRDTVDAVLIMLYYNRVTIMGEDISWEELLNS